MSTLFKESFIFINVEIKVNIWEKPNNIEYIENTPLEYFHMCFSGR